MLIEKMNLNDGDETSPIDNENNFGIFKMSLGPTLEGDEKTEEDLEDARAVENSKGSKKESFLNNICQKKQ